MKAVTRLAFGLIITINERMDQGMGNVIDIDHKDAYKLYREYFLLSPQLQIWRR
jgi:hypothetical protein